MKKTKIVATIGPSTTDAKKIEELLMAGVNVMRMNFLTAILPNIRLRLIMPKLLRKNPNPCGLVAGFGRAKNKNRRFLQRKHSFGRRPDLFVDYGKNYRRRKRVCINYALLPKEVEVGGFIMLHDGKKKLEIMSIKGNEVVCKVIIGGEIKGKRGVNLPGAKLSISSLTKKDKDDLEFGIKNKVDFVAFSFVRRPDDVSELRDILDKAKSKAQIIAKIEDVEGLENIDKIIELVDGIMIGRGDFGIEIGVENMPMVQKEIIKKCNKAGKPVITATHMLESMINSPVPTRAEVSDIANAILDGTDAIMLSEETALGQYPVEAVKMMAKVAERVEREMGYVKKIFRRNG